MRQRQGAQGRIKINRHSNSPYYFILRVSPAHPMSLAGATEATFFTYLDGFGGGHTWHEHCTCDRLSTRATWRAERRVLLLCQTQAGRRGVCRGRARRAYGGSGGRRDAAARKDLPRFPRSIHSAMKISAEPLSTGGGTQVARATAHCARIPVVKTPHYTARTAKITIHIQLFRSSLANFHLAIQFCSPSLL